MSDDDIPTLLPEPPPEDEEPPPRRDPPFAQLSDKIPLAAPRMWTRGFMILCALITFGLYLLTREVSEVMEGTLPWMAWLAPAAVLAIIMVIRRVLMPREPREIRFHEDQVEFPRGRNSRRTYRDAYEDINTIVPLVSRGQPALVIDGESRVHIFVASDFPHPDLWRVVWGQLMERISRRPNAAEQIRSMRDLSQLSQETSAVSPRFTKRLFWIIAAIFAAQVFLAPPVDVLEYLYFGANSQVMVLEHGQWWRLITANLLHGGALHFGVNAFALYFLGTYCERLLGQTRTIVLILATALAGSAASLLGTGALFSVGISTALFGLLGAYLALHLRFRRQLPPPYRQSRRWWIVILGLNAILSIAVPIIDGWGHFGGFAAGLAIAWFMTSGQEIFRPRPPAGGFMNLTAALLVALFSGASAWALGYAVTDHPEDEVIIAEALLKRADEEEPALLIQVARQWSRHSPRPAEVNPVLVAMAEAAHDRADDLFLEWRAAAIMIELAEQMADPFDRQVMQRAVVRFEHTAWRHADRDANQSLARLLTVFVEQVGPLHDAASPFAEARFTDDAKVALVPEGPLDAPRRVYVLAVDGGETQYLLRRCVPAGDTAGSAVPVDPEISPSLSLELAMVIAAERCPDDEAAKWDSVTP